MERIVIFGAGGTGTRYYSEISKSEDKKIVAFLDNSRVKQGTTINGINVLPPEKIKELDYTVVVVVTPGFEEDILHQLMWLGVDREKIAIPASKGSENIAVRNQWLKDFAQMVNARGIVGNVAEAGVFRGDFAKQINGEFPDKTLYLFDTFEGFPAEDVAREEKPSNSKAGYYDFASEELVLGKLPHPSKAVIKKGYFPKTALGVDDTFCFVNLDLDLYQPTLGGLKFFHDKMSEGGVILIHDYFGIDFPNVKTAVSDFEKNMGIRLKLFPIGDGVSIGILC